MVLGFAFKFSCSGGMFSGSPFQNVVRKTLSHSNPNFRRSLNRTRGKICVSAYFSMLSTALLWQVSVLCPGGLSSSGLEMSQHPLCFQNNLVVVY